MNTYEITGRSTQDMHDAAEAVLAVAPADWDGRVTRQIAKDAADRLGGEWDAAAIQSLTDSIAFT